MNNPKFQEIPPTHFDNNTPFVEQLKDTHMSVFLCYPEDIVNAIIQYANENNIRITKCLRKHEWVHLIRAYPVEMKAFLIAIVSEMEKNSLDYTF